MADIFAGSGALGIEALSRGAASAVFIDSSREACVAIEKNLESLGAEAKIVRGDCLREMPSKNVDLVFADPPYGFEAWEQLLDCATDYLGYRKQPEYWAFYRLGNCAVSALWARFHNHFACS